MSKWIALLVSLLATEVQAAIPVLTRSFDNARTGANTSETVLTPATVAAGLKRIFSLDIPDDPRVEAQPLYVPGVTMSDNRKHDVLYVFSMANTVWAFDVNTGKRIWQDPVHVGEPYRPRSISKPGFPKANDVDQFGINVLWGILSTPVIDLDAQAIYLVNWVKVGQGKRELQLHALRLQDGKQFKPALTVTASKTNDAGKQVALRPDQKQRAALLLTPLRGPHKTLIVATAGGENPGAPNGWVVAFDVDTWQHTGDWVATPGSFGGGIWQASQGPAADDSNAVYLMTGNGGYLTDNTGKITRDFVGKTDFPESFVKLQIRHGGKLELSDWFTPFRDSARSPKPIDYRDQDLGSGGPVVPPGTDLVLGAGKDGVLYVLDRNDMGKVVGNFSKLKSPPIFFTYFPGPEFPPTGNLDFQGNNLKTHHLHGSPLFWSSPGRGPMLFDWGENECLRAWTIDATGKVTFVAKSREIASQALANPTAKGEGGMPGGMLSLSANGNTANTGVVWATAPLSDNANARVVEGILRAYDATTLDSNNNQDGTHRLKLLWDSTRLPDADPRKHFAFSKFCPPFVADGKLFVTTYGSWPDPAGNHGRIDIYTLK
jgi:hypothetical protein